VLGVGVWSKILFLSCRVRDRESGGQAVTPSIVPSRWADVRFPLYAKGVERYRYEYAVFLLNKNIEMVIRRNKNIAKLTTS
jgi:hypothetical protein